MLNALFKHTYSVLLVLALTTNIVVNAQEVRVIDNKGTLATIRNNQVTLSNTAPTNPLEGDVWYDANTTPIIVKIWDEPSGQWEEVPGLNNFWSLTGNAGTNPATNFLGTTDAQDLVFRTRNIEAMRINQANQNVGIGTPNPERTLHVAGDNAGVRLDRYGSDAFFFFANFNAAGNTVLQNWAFINSSADNSFEVRNYGTALGGGAPTALRLKSTNQVQFPSYGTPVTFDATTVQKLLGVENDGSIVQIAPNALPTPLTTFSQDDTPTSTDPTATGEITYQDEEGDSFTAQVVSADADNSIEVGTDGGAYLGPSVYTGFFIIDNTTLTGTGTYSQSVAGLPFQPSQITFVAHANIGSFNINDDNATGNNNTNLLENTSGTMNGFVRNDGGTINQAVIYVGTHGNSVNDISRYSNNTQCIGLRYTNQNGDNNGVIAASLNSFDTNGFTLNVTYTEGTTGGAGVRDDILDESVIVMYTAYR